MRAYARGDAAVIPYDLGVQLVAARYGQSPATVRAWPARDYLHAVAMLGATDPLARMGGEG